MGKAIVVGSINMDVVAFVDRHPLVGETIFGSDIKYFPGGKGANQAVSCKRLGCPTAMVGRIGDDEFGAKMLDFLSAEGIDTTGVSKAGSGCSTGTAFITVNRESENSIIVISGANYEWKKDFTDDLQVSASDVMIAQFEVPDGVIEKSFETAKSAKATTVLNPAPVRSCPETVLHLTDVLVVNEIELEALSAMKTEKENDDAVFRAAECLAQQGPASIVVTLGSLGVRVLSGGQKHRIEGCPVTAVDTTGAGDCFIGGLSAGLMMGLSLFEASRLGNLAASISVTREGAGSSIPTLDEINQAYGVEYQ